ncbi:acyl-CoA dehydrogenase [Rhodococcus sp. MS16]|uniref:acyl-CoA dehydrogenase family protein n=1 Tax=Rhodococcus sp. MS16 TaxID=2579941 RepID=UPI001562766C|nr:acyl-CoA dehydrogenase family protein [Rhodococcus sp. MS16]NRI64195.1 acyl-CoA dehydrogenase [Rhodococcus sp. MS16]
MTVSELATHVRAQAVTAANTHPLVASAKQYADAVLLPTALETDRHGVTPERIVEFSDLHLLNHLAPAEFDGAHVDRHSDRLLHEVLAGACLNTWLVWAQHAPVVGRLADAHAAGTELPPIAHQILRGRLLTGAAISDVRRYPDHFIAATRESAGWTFSGTISWVSGWGLNTVLMVAAVESSTRTVVTALVPINERVQSSDLELSAVAGSRTERVTLSEVFVPEAHVISRVPLSKYRTTDFSTASDARPHHFGLADRVLGELEQAHPTSRELADLWRPRIAQLRTDAYALSDAAKSTGNERHRIDERLAAKVAMGEALVTLTHALVIARAGRGIVRDNTAQLYARTALFVLVQGQTAEVRDAQLSHLAQIRKKQ